MLLPPLLTGLVAAVSTGLFVAFIAAGSPDNGLATAMGLGLLAGLILVGRLGSAVGAWWAWPAAIFLTPFPAYLLVLRYASRFSRRFKDLDLP